MTLNVWIIIPISNCSWTVKEFTTSFVRGKQNNFTNKELYKLLGQMFVVLCSQLYHCFHPNWCFFHHKYVAEPASYPRSISWVSLKLQSNTNLSNVHGRSETWTLVATATYTHVSAVTCRSVSRADEQVLWRDAKQWRQNDFLFIDTNKATMQNNSLSLRSIKRFVVCAYPVRN